jgi:cyanate permease
VEIQARAASSSSVPSLAEAGFANLAGAVAPALSGFLIDRTGKFVLPFVITAVLLGAGSLSWAFWVDRVEQVTWKSEQRTAPAAANT